MGNQLFPLMHAAVFAKINRLPFIVTGYHQIKVRPYLKAWNNKRNYTGYFAFQKNILPEWIDKAKVWRRRRQWKTIYEPFLHAVDACELQGRVFWFEKMPAYHDYFGKLMEHRQLVKDLLWDMLKKNIKEQFARYQAPVIGVHIRLGDFRKLAAGEEFVGGHVRAPEAYYINIITGIRKINGKTLAATVFTDGYGHEIKNILQLPATEVAQSKPDIVDLLLLGRSKIIVMAPGSTFSAWAAFLSEDTVIKFTDKFQPLRPLSLQEKVYEGIFDCGKELLIQNIKAIS